MSPPPRAKCPTYRTICTSANCQYVLNAYIVTDNPDVVIYLKVWMTIVESGWYVWVWLVGVVSRRRMWLVGVGGIYGCG